MDGVYKVPFFAPYFARHRYILFIPTSHSYTTQLSSFSLDAILLITLIMISPANLAILALNILPATLAVPLASPEVAGAGGECMKPTIKVNSVNKVKLGPFLTTGVSSEAAPGGMPNLEPFSLSIS